MLLNKVYAISYACSKRDVTNITVCELTEVDNIQSAFQNPRKQEPFAVISGYPPPLSETKGFSRYISKSDVLVLTESLSKVHEVISSRDEVNSKNALIREKILMLEHEMEKEKARLSRKIAFLFDDRGQIECY